MICIESGYFRRKIKEEVIEKFKRIDEQMESCPGIVEGEDEQEG